MDKLRYIDLFAGCGGLSLGLGKAGLRGVFAVEKNPMAFATFDHNLLGENSHFDWPEWLPQETHDLDEILTKFKKQLIGLRGKIDVVAGGPPCQGFSMAGKRQENDIRNSLVHSYLKFVKLVQPRIIFFENVAGIMQRFRGEDGKMGQRHSDIVAKHLISLGYSFPSHELLDLSEFGLPQSRRRFIMVAVRGNESPSDFFKLLRDQKKPFLKEKGLPETSNVGRALSDLLETHGVAPCPDGGRFQSGKYGAAKNGFQRLMRQGGRKGQIPDSHRFANHQPQTVSVFDHLLSTAPVNVGLRGEEARSFGVKKRNVTVLDEASPSPTILSIPDDYVHYKEPRILTVRECARLQTFPDDFHFVGKYTTGGQMRKVEVPRYTQVGNAIPPLFAEQVGRVLKYI